MADSSGGGGGVQATPQPPTQRRPRVKEVSSRFMSPLLQSNSNRNCTPIPSSNSSHFPRSKSALRRQLSRIDENHDPQSNCNHHHPPKSVLPSTLRSKESARVSSRPPDTPMSTIGSRIVPSRYRQVSTTVHRSNPLNKSIDGCGEVTAAAKLLQKVTSDAGSKLSRISTSRDDIGLRSSTSSIDTASSSSSSCPSSPLCAVQNVPEDTRSSINKCVADRNSGKVPSDCVRSLNILRPPNPLTRHRFDATKGQKMPYHQEDVHSLKMLNNHYLQWRFANAKALASMKAQKKEAEKNFYSLCGTLSNIRDRVKIEREELKVLRRIKTLTTVLESQTPYLEEWASVEEDYLTSLSGTTNALLSSSSRIPVSVDARADAGEVREVLSSALNMLQLIGVNIQRFMMKAEKMDGWVMELAKLAGGERNLIEECRDLLWRTHSSQVKECSLRGCLMQSCISNTTKKD